MLDEGNLVDFQFHHFQCQIRSTRLCLFTAPAQKLTKVRHIVPAGELSLSIVLSYFVQNMYFEKQLFFYHLA